MVRSTVQSADSAALGCYGGWGRSQWCRVPVNTGGDGAQSCTQCVRGVGGRARGGTARRCRSVSDRRLLRPGPARHAVEGARRQQIAPIKVFSVRRCDAQSSVGCVCGVGGCAGGGAARRCRSVPDRRLLRPAAARLAVVSLWPGRRRGAALPPRPLWTPGPPHLVTRTGVTNDRAGRWGGRCHSAVASWRRSR